MVVAREVPGTNGGAVSEVRPLLDTGGERGILRGGTEAEAAEEDDDWEYAMVFNRVARSTDVVPEAEEILRSIFKERVVEPWQDTDVAFWDRAMDNKMTKAELFEAVSTKVVDILGGPSCGFELGWRMSLNEEQVLLLIRLRDRDTVEQIAQRLKYHMPVTQVAYAVKGIKCPTVAPSLRQRLGLSKRPPHPAPIYLRFERKRLLHFAEAGKKRMQKAGEILAQMLADPDPSSAASKESFRRMMRLEDIRAAVMVMLVYRLTKPDQKTSQQTQTVMQQLFAKMNEVLEAKNKDLEYNMQQLPGETERFQARLRRWTPPEFPAFEDLQDAVLYQDFTDLDRLRLMKNRVAMFMDVAYLTKHEIISDFFPIHKAQAVADFRNTRWSSLSPLSLCQWPGGQHNEAIRRYFGEEVAFFFNWLYFVTRMLMVPACLGITSFVACHFLLEREENRNLAKVSIAVVMCIWIASSSSLYSQEATTFNLVWGMKGYATKGLQRSDYRAEKRGSRSESAVRSFHWFLVVLFLLETICSAYYFNDFRRRALREASLHPGEKMALPFGIRLSGRTAQQLGLYAVTVNIKAVNFLWGWVSPVIARRENWRTDQQLKNQQVSKTFLVKMVVNYYPFFYLAFIQDLVEGCHGNECMVELQKNLLVFFATHILTVIGGVVAQMVWTWWTEWRSKKQATQAGKAARISAAEDEAIKPAYAGDTDDYMELNISLGFITMFSSVFPLLAVIGLVSNMLESRVLAYRMVYVLQRPVPRGQEGIGSWLMVMHLIAHLSGIVSVALWVFAMEPAKSWPLRHKLTVFILVEHGMIALVEGIRQYVPATTATDELIIEGHDEAEARILAADTDEVVARSGGLACLQPHKAFEPTPGTRLPIVRRPALE